MTHQKEILTHYKVFCYQNGITYHAKTILSMAGKIKMLSKRSLRTDIEIQDQSLLWCVKEYGVENLVWSVIKTEEI